MTPNNTDSTWIIGVVIFSVGLLGVLVWSILRWKKLKPELFPDTTTAASPLAVSREASVAARLECAAKLVTRARATLEHDDTPLARAGVEALRKLESSAEIPSAIDALMMKSRETAGVESLLVRSGGSYGYLVAIPNRHEHAHLLRRYAPFSGGWRRHFELVRTSLAASGEFTNMAAILLFLNPEKRESTLQVSCCDIDSMLIPSTLAEAPDLNATGVTLLDSSMEFSLAA